MTEHVVTKRKSKALQAMSCLFSAKQQGAGHIVELPASTSIAEHATSYSIAAWLRNEMRLAREDNGLVFLRGTNVDIG